jgi:predicted dehydrogenase
VEVLLQLLPVTSKVLIYSPRNKRLMDSWIHGRRFGERVSVFDSPPVLPISESRAVIVVNAAVDHERSVEWALSQGAAVLVEKPLTLTFGASRRLVEKANRQGVYLAAAHVFLFAGYLHGFRREIQALGQIATIDVLWADAAGEVRQGETKSFDPGLRIFEDCIPHVMSMLEVLDPGVSPVIAGLELFRGGAELKLVFASPARRYTVRLVRNGQTRRRVLTVTSPAGACTLDFSHEPGTITNGAKKMSALPDWDSAQKPMSCMLEGFLVAAGGGHRDPRLEPTVGLRAARLSEEISPVYTAAQAEWLSKRLVAASDNDEDFYYALREIAIMDDPQIRSIPEDTLKELVGEVKHEAQAVASKDLLVSELVELVLNRIRTKRWTTGT